MFHSTDIDSKSNTPVSDRSGDSNYSNQENTYQIDNNDNDKKLGKLKLNGIIYRTHC